MSDVVDRWVARLKGKLPPVGTMTHWQRMAAAFDLKPVDLPPVAPELDYWQITHAGYTHREIYNDVDKTTDACLKTWADLRTDAIWMYVDISHQIEHFIPKEKRAEHFIHRGDKDYLMFKPVAKTLDEAIGLYESRAFETHIADSRAVTHYTPHMLQLLEFQEKMDRVVPVIVGIATPANYAETLVEVQQFVRWTITEPASKVKHYLDLALAERLAALDFYEQVARKNGCEFVCLFGGARTWGPKQMAQFGYCEQEFAEKAAKIFPYVFWHICGHNLPEAMTALTQWKGLKGVQYDVPYYSQKLEWADWCGSVAKLFSGKRCAMNAPTTQAVCHGTEAEVRTMVREFLERTSPHTTAVVMPGCEIDSFSPEANVRAMIEEARKFRTSAPAGPAAAGRRGVLAALAGERVRPVPVGAVTQSATFAQMEAAGARWPEAHADARKMSDLAAAAHEMLGFDLVRVPFDQTVEAELLGAEIDRGGEGANCSVRSHPLEPGRVPESLPDFSGGRAGAVVEAVSLLRKRVGDQAALIGGVVGPFTLAGQLVGLQTLLMEAFLEPGKYRPLLDFTVRVAIEYARRQRRAGADAICVEDMAASLDLVSPKIYEDLILPAQARLVSSIEGPVVLHVCGGNTKILGLLARTGAALSLESRTDLAAAVRQGGRGIVGGVPPVEALLNGTPADVRRAAEASLSAGVHVLAPGCGIPPRTSTENLKELVRAAREWRG